MIRGLEDVVGVGGVDKAFSEPNDFLFKVFGLEELVREGREGHVKVVGDPRVLSPFGLRLPA